MVNEMAKGIGVTLKKLEKVAKKYEILGSNSKRRQLWTKFKWSVEFSDIDALRNKVCHPSITFPGNGPYSCAFSFCITIPS